MGGRNGGPQQKRAIDAGRFLRDPRTSRTPAPAGLLLGEHDGAMGLAALRQAASQRCSWSQF